MMDRWMFFVKNLLVATLVILVGGCATTARFDASRYPANQEPQWGKTELFPSWAYDAGPDIDIEKGCPNPATEMGCQLIDINSSIPYMPGISNKLLGVQKFRPAFGPMPWRMLQKPNSVKILFIGQDGTHIAEAAGRPATAGFGGRAQDLAKYFGVGPGAAFINAYAFTIEGQDGSANVPVLSMFNGKSSLRAERVIDNNLWLMSRHLDSPVVQWRNDLIEWIIRNNRDSLKMIVTFGKPAQDAAAAFVLSRAKKFSNENKGTIVGSRYTAEELAKFNVKVPEFRMVGTGSNGEGPVLIGAKGQDLFKEELGLKLSKDFDGYQKPLHDQAVKDFITKSKTSDAVIQKMVFSNTGLHGSGVIDPVQVGGYMIAEKMVIAPERNGPNPTISLKGLKIAEDMEPLDRDLIVVDLPHPTYLSNVQRDYDLNLKVDPSNTKGLKTASFYVNEKVTVLKPYTQKGWRIEADNFINEDTNKPAINSFDAGQPYTYGRGDMGPEFYDFGAPASRMVNKSDATRMGDNVIVFGDRSKDPFKDSKEVTAQINASKKGMPENMPSKDEMWTMRPRSKKARYIYDSGPPTNFARVMKENLPKDVIASHQVNRDYGHYRGTFKNPKVIILADQDGWDDLITARALSGSRGQYIQGLMNDLGVGDQYLVIKTAPFSTEEDDWQDIFEKTKTYREMIAKEIVQELASNQMAPPKLILIDGKYAVMDFYRILKGKTKIPPVINIMRNASGPAGDSGIMAAADEIRKRGVFGNFEVKQPRLADLPRSHLSYYARIWEGTSGDRVFTAPEPKAGAVDAKGKPAEDFSEKLFAEVVPFWASAQEYQTQSSEMGIEGLEKIAEQNKVRKGGESVPAFLQRVGNQQVAAQ